MTPDQIEAMPWSEWRDKRRYVDWRLKIPNPDLPDEDGEAEELG